MIIFINENVDVEREASNYANAQTLEDKIKIISKISDEDMFMFDMELDFEHGILLPDEPPEIASIYNDSNKRYRKQLQKTERKLIDPKKIWYRGTRGKSYGVDTRSGYATFLTDDINQAASYAGPDGVITEVQLKPAVVEQYNKPNEEFRTFLDLDQKAMKLPSHKALIFYGVRDSGPFRNDMKDPMAATYASTNVAVRDLDKKYYKLGKTYSASKFF